MLSIFAFILLLNTVLALPSPRPFPVTESLVSVSNTGRINATRAGQANEADHARDLFQRTQPKANQARGNLKARQLKIIEDTFSTPITCDQILCTAVVGIGTPPKMYTLQVDTGSSNTWVGANQPFVSTSSTIVTGQNVSVTYGTGQFSGIQVTDTLTLSPNLVIKAQGIGVANQSQGFQEGIDGILGIGPTDLTQGTLSPNINDTIPTVVDSLHKQGIIKSSTVSIQSQPLGPSDSATGELIFGGTDSSTLTSEVVFFPVTTSKVGDANQFWALNVDMSYGTTKLVSNGVALVDVGSAQLQLADDVFDNYRKATGAVDDVATGRLTITLAQFEALQPLNFTFLQNTYSLSPNAQILPRKVSDDPDVITLVAALSPLGSSDQGFGVTLGTTFMQYIFTAYDSDNNEVGMATTQFTNAAVN